MSTGLGKDRPKRMKTPGAWPCMTERISLSAIPRPDMSAAVEIEQVTKTFGSHTAVDNLSLQVPLNSIYGFIRPHGSGKTTTLRMIMRIYLPDAGHIHVLGEEVWQAASDRVAYLPEERGLYKKMKVRDVLRFYAELKGRRDSSADINEWLEKLGL